MKRYGYLSWRGVRLEDDPDDLGLAGWAGIQLPLLLL